MSRKNPTPAERERARDVEREMQHYETGRGAWLRQAMEAEESPTPERTPMPAQQTLQPSDSHTLRIVELYVENVKYIKAVTVRPQGDVTIVAGRNSQGKTSLMDALAMALGGAKLVPKQPIRAGQKSAKVVVDLDKYRVERRFTEKGSTLHVTGKEGETFRSPQELLDRLVGDLTFDPSEFIRMKEPEQLVTLQLLVGVDLRPLNTERDQKFAQRTNVNREVKRLAAVVTAMPRHADAPMKEIELGDMATRLQETATHNEALIKARADIADTLEALEALDGSIDLGKQARTFLADEQLAAIEIAGQAAGVEIWIRRAGGNYRSARDEADEVERLLQAAEFRRAKLIGVRDVQQAALEAYIAEAGDTTDPAALIDEYTEAEALNKMIRENIAYRDKAAELKAVETQSADFTKRIEAIENEKRELLAAAKFPVRGLSFTDDTVTFNGTPFLQASSSDQIRVSFGMALALNADKPLRLCLIRAGAFLDEDNLALIEEMAIDAKCQVWIERVSNGGECAVVIEAGEVKA